MARTKDSPTRRLYGPPPTHWRTDAIDARIIEFCANNPYRHVRPAPNGNMAIAAMLFREFHLVLAKNQIAGAVSRLGIDRQAGVVELPRSEEERAWSSAKFPPMVTRHEKRKDAQRLAYQGRCSEQGLSHIPEKNRSHHKAKTAPADEFDVKFAKFIMASQPIPEIIQEPLEFIPPPPPVPKPIRPVTMPSHVKRALEAAQRDRNHISPFDNVAYRPVIRSAPTSMPVIGHASTCQWPFGDPGTPTFRFCGDIPERGRSYCLECCQRGYVNYRRTAA